MLRNGGPVEAECSSVESGRVSALFRNHSLFAGARGKHTQHTRREEIIQRGGSLLLIDNNFIKRFAPTPGRDTRVPMR